MQKPSCQIWSHFYIIKRFLASRHSFIYTGILSSAKIRLNYWIASLLSNVLLQIMLVYLPLYYSICNFFYQSQFKWHCKNNQNLNPNSSHSQDMISIRMPKTCGNSIYKPLQIIMFRCCTTAWKVSSYGVFSGPFEWNSFIKKVNE